MASALRIPSAQASSAACVSAWMDSLRTAGTASGVS